MRESSRRTPIGDQSNLPQVSRDGRASPSQRGATCRARSSTVARSDRAVEQRANGVEQPKSTRKRHNFRHATAASCPTAAGVIAVSSVRYGQSGSFSHRRRCMKSGQRVDPRATSRARSRQPGSESAPPAAPTTVPRRASPIAIDHAQHMTQGAPQPSRTSSPARRPSYPRTVGPV